jgi:hypothetical protein
MEKSVFCIKKRISDLEMKLWLGDLSPTSESDIPLNRPKGLDSSNIIRKLRDERVDDP